MSDNQGKRELIEPTEGDKRYVRRDDEGQFKEQVDVSRSLRQDVQQDAENEVESGHGDKGDQS